MTMPRPVRIFHITAIDNLPMICQHEALWSKAKSTGLGITYNNIAHKGAQSTLIYWLKIKRVLNAVTTSGELCK